MPNSSNLTRTYALSDFDFTLPPDLIAQVPAVQRTASRLLHVDGGHLENRLFTDLPALLAPGDLVVFNDTRVLKARVFAHKASGGKAELLVERVTGERQAWVQLRSSHAPRPDATLHLPGGGTATVRARDDRFYLLDFAVDRAAGRLARSPRRACRCLPTSDAAAPAPPRSTRRAIRPSTPARRAPWRRPPRDCTSTTRCWRDSTAPASRAPS